MDKAKEYLEALKLDYNQHLASHAPFNIIYPIKTMLKGAKEMYELLSNEECCIEEDRYGELELYFYEKEE